MEEYHDYSYVVTAMYLDPEGESFYSNEATAQAVNAPAPENLSASGVYPGQIIRNLQG